MNTLPASAIARACDKLAPRMLHTHTRRSAEWPTRATRRTIKGHRSIAQPPNESGSNHRSPTARRTPGRTKRGRVALLNNQQLAVHVVFLGTMTKKNTAADETDQQTTTTTARRNTNTSVLRRKANSASEQYNNNNDNSSKIE